MTNDYKLFASMNPKSLTAEQEKFAENLFRALAFRANRHSATLHREGATIQVIGPNGTFSEFRLFVGQGTTELIEHAIRELDRALAGFAAYRATERFLRGGQKATWTNLGGLDCTPKTN